MPRLQAVLLCLACWVTQAGALTLTPDEQAWLRQHPQLRLGVDTSWPPFEFRDDAGRYQGLAASYVRLAAERLQVQLQPSEPSNWNAVLDLARKGQVDLLPGVMATPERSQYLTFTRPYLDFPIVILSRKDGPTPDSLKALYGLKVGVVDHYAPHELLIAKHPDLNLQPAPSVAAALQALATGQVDAFVGDLASSVWSLRQLKLEGIQISGDTPYRYQLAMAVPRGEPILAGILDKVFADLSNEEIEALQAPWVGGILDARPSWSHLLGIGLPALALSLAIFAILFAMNRRLRAEVARREKLELALRDSEQHFRGLVESMTAIAWEMRLAENRFTYVSPHAQELLGYPQPEWLEPGFWQRTLHPADAEATVSYCLSESRAGRNHSMDYRMLAADGRVVWIRDIITLIKHGDELILRGLMIDITEAKRTEQALRLSEQKFASVFHHCPDIIVLARRIDGRLLAVNSTFEQQVGIPAIEALGKTATELNIWGHPGMGARMLERLQGENLDNIETTLQRRDGTRFTALLSAQRVALDDNPALVVVVRNIAQLKQTQEQLRASEEKFAKAFHASPDGLLITRISDGLLLEANEGFTRITGYDRDQRNDRSTLEMRLWADPDDRERLLKMIREQSAVQDFTAFIRTREGTARLCELSAHRITIGEDDCLLTIARDITERQQMQEKLTLAATVFESTAEGVMITDASQRIIAVNRAFSEITGYGEDEVLGQSPRLLSSGQHDSSFYVAMWHHLNADGHWQGEIWNRRKSGELYPEWLTISSVRGNNGEISHFVGVFADISTLKYAQARLDYQAHHDPLTGLPNRLLFETRLTTALKESQEEQQLGAVLFLDLDRFKHINDSLGHPVGDQLLKSIARRLREQLRDVDTVARQGGDEFIILLPGLHQPSDADHVAKKLLHCFSHAFVADDKEFFVSSSIGISLFPVDGKDVATLVKNADAAMYRAKAQGRNRVEFYTRELTFQANERVALEHELRRALETHQLQLYYQPKQALDSGALVGAEALIRWSHPKYGAIPPDRFIPLAEETGLILPLGTWVLEEACRQMSRWQQSHAAFGPLSVNLAGAQLYQQDVVEQVRELLDRYGLYPPRLQLEITENFLMHQTDDALRTLHALKRLGVQLAIDDFGTGYSSLSYLKQLPLDILKIDQSFVHGLPDDAHDVAIARAIIALGRSMGLTIIAEGVEREEQERFLAEEGCDHVQGYALSPPLPADQFAARFLTPLQPIGAPQSTPV
ncbi:bifunctional diguanylate cyclase/phosphodiesterase [Pseudomonas citronellolis]|uniref:bifunctional diguanylate cyclase/phosphodiesterase n=1 Tax=Pseudomonas citronellolis TaxID=53408 RepID=UPI0023E40812|nr:EAL domain-containing protein [Pseudomonas citronellolis]MDF3935508.1 EAL domain-containing protein [Pseudomonas citronellolis]